MRASVGLGAAFERLDVAAPRAADISALKQEAKLMAHLGRAGLLKRCSKHRHIKTLPH